MDPVRGDPFLATECVRMLGAPPEAVERLTHSVRASTTTGVTRVRTAGRSAVVKVVAPRSTDPADASRRPGSFRYWRREAFILESELLAPYRAAGLRPPSVLGRFERGPEAIALWLENASGSSADEWPVDAFNDAARRLGRAQGAIAGAGPTEAPWVSRGFLREYLADAAARVPYRALVDDAAWRQPLVAGHWAAELREPLERLHAEQSWFVDQVEAVPSTLAHLDVWPHNLFGGGDDVILIDWAFAGIGALGEDVGNLVLDSVWDLLHPAAILPALDGAVTAGYLDGLRDVGWRGDERLVRLAICASAVKYDWLAPVMLAEAADETMTGYGGRPVEDRPRLYAERGAALAYLVSLADEARALAAELGPTERG
jgi:hypothetical protein